MDDEAHSAQPPLNPSAAAAGAESAPFLSAMTPKETATTRVPAATLVSHAAHDSTSNNTASNDDVRKRQELCARRWARIMSLNEDQELFGNNSNTIAKLLVECPKCGQQLGATRFAMHYERCLNKGSRARANSTSISASASGRSISPTGSATPSWTAGCSSCHMAESPELMLLCDGCSRVFHMWCLVPRLNEVPNGVWFCRRCSQRLVGMSEISNTAKRKRQEQKLTALDKVNNGRVAAGFDIVEFVCDICNEVIEPTETRFRCLTCGEFDVCGKCRKRGGKGHRSTHEMAELKL